MSKLNQREKSIHLRLKVLKSITYFCPFCDNEIRLSRQQKQVRGGVVISSPPSENAAKLIYCLKDGPEGEGGGELKKVLRREAPPQGPAPYPYLYTV